MYEVPPPSSRVSRLVAIVRAAALIGLPLLPLSLCSLSIGVVNYVAAGFCSDGMSWPDPDPCIRPIRDVALRMGLGGVSIALFCALLLWGRRRAWSIRALAALEGAILVVFLAAVFV